MLETCSAIIDDPRGKTTQLLRSLSRAKVRSPTNRGSRQHADHFTRGKKAVWDWKSYLQKHSATSHNDRWWWAVGCSPGARSTPTRTANRPRHHAPYFDGKASG